MLPIVVLVPVLHRPWRAQPLAESLAAATPGPYRLLFVCTEGDEQEISACHATGADVLITPGPRMPGDFATKINAGYRATTEPLMLLAGDDVIFRSGWHEEVSNAAEQGWGVIGTQDLGNRHVLAGIHSTHPVVTRSYADEYGTVDGPGRVVCEEYGHAFVDNELVDTAKARNKWVFCNGAVVEHLHPNWHPDKVQVDPTYRLGLSTFEADRATFVRRRRMWE
jgi:hypothetical protein